MFARTPEAPYFAVIFTRCGPRAMRGKAEQATGNRQREMQMAPRHAWHFRFPAACCPSPVLCYCRRPTVHWRTRPANAVFRTGTPPAHPPGMRESIDRLASLDWSLPEITEEDEIVLELDAADASDGSLWEWDGSDWIAVQS